MTTAEALIEQIRRRMEIEAERARRPRPVPAAEERSVETLVPAGGEEAHEDFHERYIQAPQPVEDWGKRAVRRGRIDSGSAREAIIWGAIFGKPKGWMDTW
jgi:hypothetical protein